MSDINDDDITRDGSTEDAGDKADKADEPTESDENLDADGEGELDTGDEA